VEDHCSGSEEGGSFECGAAAFNPGTPIGFAGFALIGGETAQGGDRLGGKQAELWEFGEDDARGLAPHTWNRRNELGLGGQFRICGDDRVDGSFGFGDRLLQHHDLGIEPGPDLLPEPFEQLQGGSRTPPALVVDRLDGWREWAAQSVVPR